uniref:Ubiquitin-like domain-containing protein n=1 Tax=Cuerna arida TaxID=1464854 RepID=A0A1B6F5T0_9HEMI
MYVLIRGEQINAIPCKEEETIRSIREQIAEAKNVDLENVQLSANGYPVDDEDVLGDYENVVLELQMALLGGKVHGSLSRAGKVRGQTPKVEKKEKKKPKTGRAKRRLQYNRRVLNSLSTFGRKRGPNANS